MAIVKIDLKERWIAALLGDVVFDTVTGQPSGRYFDPAIDRTQIFAEIADYLEQRAYIETHMQIPDWA